MRTRHPSYPKAGEPAERWRARAACRGLGPSLFYPEDLEGDDVRRAKELCSRCAVVADCLATAVAAGERYGIWGGATPRERRRLKRTAAKTA